MEEVEKLIEEAVKDTDATNETFADGEKIVEEANNDEPFNQTEGDVVPEENAKEVWQEDENENAAQAAKDAPESGAFSSARAAWGNGWSY